jgi:hypothetical protein
MLWQGGFTFYAGVVVPIGTEVLGSGVRQGEITGRVTVWLNLIGVVCLALLAWDQAAGGDPSARRRAARWWLWGVCVALLGVLFVSHPMVRSFMTDDGRRVAMPGPFRILHGVYLWTSTLHWILMLPLVLLTVAGWRGGDGASEVGSQRSEPGTTEGRPGGGPEPPPSVL